MVGGKLELAVIGGGRVGRAIAGMCRAKTGEEARLVLRGQRVPPNSQARDRKAPVEGTPLASAPLPHLHLLIPLELPPLLPSLLPSLPPPAQLLALSCSGTVAGAVPYSILGVLAPVARQS